MTTLTTTQINEMAQQILMSLEGGESKTILHTYKGYEAEINYTCEVSVEEGDYWTAPSWDIVSDKIEVVNVWDIINEVEATDVAEQLAKLLN